jgi:hypothetical protein
MSGYVPTITDDTNAGLSVDRDGKHGIEIADETIDTTSGDLRHPTLQPGTLQA